jgi:hypothetical protein
MKAVISRKVKNMKNNSNEPPPFAIKFANTVFMLGMLFSVLLVVYVVYKMCNPRWLTHTSETLNYYYIYILFGGISATLFGLGLRMLSNGLKVNLSVLFVTAGISVYAFETYLEFSQGQPPNLVKARAEQMGVPYDTRTKMEVLEGLNDSGVEAYPNILPNIFVTSNGLNTTKGKIYPLGGISNISTIFGNESGYYPIIETDEHGFNNPKGLYKKNRVDIVLTGDSFTEGYSVHSDESLSAVLRKSGFNAISIGKGANSSLLEFAALKEYAEPLRPIIVLWLYYGGDLRGILHEMKSPLLKKYLDDNEFSQNLISRQEEIDSVLINYVRVGELGEWERVERHNWNDHWLMRIPELTNLRTRFKLNPKPEPLPIPIFKNILQESKRIVSRWGGKLYFAYLPDFGQCSTDIEDKNLEFAVVMRTVTELEIPIIEIHNVFGSHPDQLSLFAFSLGHYSAEGYRLMAETISKRIKADGVIPSKPDN